MYKTVNAVLLTYSIYFLLHRLCFCYGWFYSKSFESFIINFVFFTSCACKYIVHIQYPQECLDSMKRQKHSGSIPHRLKMTDSSRSSGLSWVWRSTTMSSSIFISRWSCIGSSLENLEHLEDLKASHPVSWNHFNMLMTPTFSFPYSKVTPGPSKPPWNCTHTPHFPGFYHNGLALNPEKSEAILLGTHSRNKSLNNITQVEVNGSPIPISDNIKLLGVTLDSFLALNKHVSLICQSSQYHIRALRHIRPILDANIAKLVGHALVSSRLDYANSVMYGMSLTTKLQRQQNMLALVVLRTNRSSSARPLLSELHWLPVASRIQFKIATLTHKILTTGKPSYLSSLLNHYQPTRQLRSPGSNLLVQPHSKTKFWLCCISHHCYLESGIASPAYGQVITFYPDFQESAQNPLFPQPSHLGHVPVLRLRFVFGWAYPDPVLMTLACVSNRHYYYYYYYY